MYVAVGGFTDAVNSRIAPSQIVVSCIWIAKSEGITVTVILSETRQPAPGTVAVSVYTVVANGDAVGSAIVGLFKPAAGVQR